MSHTNNKTSNVIEQQFPFFVRNDGPGLVAFIKAYYEWAEQANNALEVSKTLLSNQDIDTTTDKYLEFFHREIMPSIPRSLIADRKLLAKHMKDMYRSRGSEQSYRLLFRALYNEEIDFYYPGEDLLRASDGRWVKETTIRVGAPQSTATFNSGDSITGITSGATATIDKIVSTLSSGILVNEYYLLNIIGTFQDNERVKLSSDATTYGTIVGETGPLQSVTVTKGGAFHQPGDILNFNALTGSGANGTVLTTNDLSAVRWKISNGGSGYQVGSAVTINHESGAESEFAVSAIGSTETITIMTETIEDKAAIVLNTGPTFISAGANTDPVSTNFATANVSSTISDACAFANATGGTITTLSQTKYGYGYYPTLPTSSITDATIAPLLIPDGTGGIKGNNASITPVYANGAIATVSMISFGSDYRKSEELTLANASRSTSSEGFSLEAGKGDPGVSGVVAYPGKYIDTKGYLSWNNKLQDNFYYQEFSYEVKSEQYTSAYKSFVDSLVHPAGTKLFGKVTFTSNVSPNTVTTTPGAATSTTITEPRYTKALGTVSIDVSTSTTARTVTGSGTDFSANTNIVANTALLINGGLYFVNTISSDTSLTIHQPYKDIGLNTTSQVNLSGGDIYYRANTTISF